MANPDSVVATPEMANNQASSLGSSVSRSGKAKGPSLKPMNQEVDSEDYRQLLELYDSTFKNFTEGEVVKGTVMQVSNGGVVVDVGYKSEGIIQVSEFLDENGEVTVESGDLVDVLLERTEDRQGHIVLSREKAEKMKI